MKCADCKFYCSSEKQCRRSSPIPAPLPQQTSLGQISVSVLGMWPPVSPHQWCGQFEAGHTEGEAPPDNAKVLKMIEAKH